MSIHSNRLFLPTFTPKNDINPKTKKGGIDVYSKCLGLFLKCLGIAITRKVEGTTYFVNKKSWKNWHSLHPSYKVSTPRLPLPSKTTSHKLTPPAPLQSAHIEHFSNEVPLAFFPIVQGITRISELENDKTVINLPFKNIHNKDELVDYFKKSINEWGIKLTLPINFSLDVQASEEKPGDILHFEKRYDSESLNVTPATLQAPTPSKVGKYTPDMHINKMAEEVRKRGVEVDIGADVVFTYQNEVVTIKKLKSGTPEENLKVSAQDESPLTKVMLELAHWTDEEIVAREATVFFTLPTQDNAEEKWLEGKVNILESDSFWSPFERIRTSIEKNRE